MLGARRGDGEARASPQAGRFSAAGAVGRRRAGCRLALAGAAGRRKFLALFGEKSVFRHALTNIIGRGVLA